MKKYILIYLILLSSQIMLSQSYVPFQFGNTRWMYNEEKMFSTKSYCYFSMDTVGYYHNGNKYSKIEFVQAPAYSPSNTVYYVFDDTTQRKVFMLDTSTNQENLLYDFSANVGDTIFSVYNGSTYGLDTVIIDSIKTINSRKYFYSHRINIAWSEICVWIEGIGSNYDLFLPSIKIPGILEVYLRLICHQHNNNINYGTVNECNNFLTSTPTFQKDDNTLQVQYNPINRYVTVSNIQNIQYHFSFFDISGKLLIKSTSNSMSKQISLHNLSSGIYFYKVTTHSNQLSGKIIVSY